MQCTKLWGAQFFVADDPYFSSLFSVLSLENETCVKPSRPSYGNSHPYHIMAGRNRRPLAPAMPPVSPPTATPSFSMPHTSTQARRNITTACGACRRRRSKVRAVYPCYTRTCTQTQGQHGLCAYSLQVSSPPVNVLCSEPQVASSC